MNLGEFCDFFGGKEVPCPISDSFVKDGYMQKKGGYIKNAWIEKGIIRDPEHAKPSQEWHLLNSYCPRTNITSLEAAGIDSKIVSDAATRARKIIDSGTNGRIRISACTEIKKIITWKMIEEKMTSQKMKQVKQNSIDG